MQVLCQQVAIEDLKKESKDGKKKTKQKPKTESEQLFEAIKPLMEVMKFTNNRKGILNPNANEKQRLW